MIKNILNKLFLKETRRFPRKRAYDLVRVRYRGGQPVEDLRNIRDLSAGGLQFFSTQPIAAGDELDLTLNLADEVRQVSVRARVAWSRRRKVRGGYDVGVSFQNLSSEDLKLIERLVS